MFLWGPVLFRGFQVMLTCYRRRSKAAYYLTVCLPACFSYSDRISPAGSVFAHNQHSVHSALGDSSAVTIGCQSGFPWLFEDMAFGAGSDLFPEMRLGCLGLRDFFRFLEGFTVVAKASGSVLPLFSAALQLPDPLFSNRNRNANPTQPGWWPADIDSETLGR